MTNHDDGSGFLFRVGRPRAGWLASLVAGALLTTGCSMPLGRTSRMEAPASDAAEMLAASQAETEAALEILERMSAYLASRPAFRLRAELSYDAVQSSGQRIEFGSEREIVVERPDRLRIEAAWWDGGREILAYDGGEVWLASPSLRAFARMDQSGEVERVIERLAALDTSLPLADLIDPGLASRLRPSIKSASRVGVVQLQGRLCDQVAYRMSDIDFQLFVERGETPVPRRLVIDYHDEPGSPQFRASIREWDVSPGSLPEEFFRVTPPIGAQRMPFKELLGLMLADPSGRSERGGER